MNTTTNHNLSTAELLSKIAQIDTELESITTEDGRWIVDRLFTTREWCFRALATA